MTEQLSFEELAATSPPPPPKNLPTLHYISPGPGPSQGFLGCSHVIYGETIRIVKAGEHCMLVEAKV